MTYSEKLKDPRWQKRKSEILWRDSFTCIVCGAKDRTLHVHHAAYVRGKDPWDYPDYMLQTICEPCHTQRTELLDKATGALLISIKDYPNSRIQTVAERLFKSAMEAI